MQKYSEYNPIAVFVHFLLTMIVCMFTLNPVIAIIATAGAIAFNAILFKLSNKKRHLYCLLTFVVFTLINPIFSHKGATVLFFVNNITITLEALLYGIFSAMLIVALLYWFFAFSHIFTSDKIIYLVSRISKKSALIISMSLRFVPLLLRKFKAVRQSLKAVGKYNTDNILDRLHSEISVFDIVLSATIENGIITADSMSARGYDTKKHSSFYPFKFCLRDGILISVSVLLFVITVFYTNKANTSFYPLFRAGSILNLGYLTYTALAFLPFFLELFGSIVWKLYQSKT